MSTFTSSRLRIDRRTLLRALGPGVGAYFLPSLLGSDRQVYAATPPKRMVLVWGNHGTVHKAWNMRRPGLAEDADWSFPFDDPSPDSWSRIMKPLHPYRSKVLAVDGLCMNSAWADPGPGNEHSKGQAHSLTGAFCAGDAVGGGPSIDQIVAGGIARPGALKSIELDVGGAVPWVFAGRSQRLPSTSSPGDAFQRLFPKGVPAAMATTAPMAAAPAPRTDADRVRAGQDRSIALARQQYEALATKLGREDRAKLELHRDLLGDLQKRFTETGPPGAAGPDVAACQAAAPKSASDFKARAEEMIKVIVAGLSCDQTRVASLQLATVPNQLVGVAAGEDLHNEYIHDTQNQRHSNSVEVLTQQNLVYAEVVASLLKGLSSVKEGTGTMLDNTLVVWCYELATGDHSFRNLPFVLAGNVGGYFKQGQWVHYGPKHPAMSQYDGRMVGPGHNRLLVTIADAMGIATDKVGEASVKARNGTTVPLTGALPELKA